MKKIDLDNAWLQVIQGKSVELIGNRKLILQAKLVRQALIQQRQRFESLKIDDDKVLAYIHQACGTTKNKNPIIRQISKWVGILILGSGVVYATKTILHFNEFQETKINTETKNETVLKNDSKGFWGEWFDSKGSFTGFWSKLQLRHYDQPINTANNNCRPDNLVFENCLKLAKENNSSAQFNIALMYEKGIQTTQNYDEAYEWYKKSAALGNVEAQFNMNFLIEKNLVNKP